MCGRVFVWLCSCLFVCVFVLFAWLCDCLFVSCVLDVCVYVVVCLCACLFVCGCVCFVSEFEYFLCAFVCVFV